MRNFFKLYLLGTLCFGSCKSLQKLTAKDSSGTTKTKQNGNGNVVFLEDVSVTPGSKRTVVTEPAQPSKKVFIPDGANRNFSMENINEMQLKYAVMLDVPVEELTNIVLLKNIEYWWGTKYCMGGSNETCTDCSGFSMNIMRDVYAVNIPRTAQEQYDNCEHIKTRELQQGDLVFFKTSKGRISHVGIYVANNKFVHASVSSGVMISDLNEEYWKQRYKGAGRVLK